MDIDRRIQTAEYIHTMLIDLERLARTAELGDMVYYLCIAISEARTTKVHLEVKQLEEQEQHH